MSRQQPMLIDGPDPAARRDEDFYATPAWQTRALLARLTLPTSGCFVEPCCGDGAIVRLLPPTVTVITNDVVVRPPMLPEFLLDAGRPASWAAFARVGRLSIAGTNPPFDEAIDIARCAYEAVTDALILLLRLSWLEPTASEGTPRRPLRPRGAWLKAHPPTNLIVLPRHDYRGNGKTDSVTSAWMVWDKTGCFRLPAIDVVTVDERDALSRP